MTDEKDEEHRQLKVRLEKYQKLSKDTNDPMATRLILDIVQEIEAKLQKPKR